MQIGNKNLRTMTLFSLVLISLISCNHLNEEEAIIGRWKVDTVQNLETDEIAPDMRASFVFRKNHEMESENQISGIKKGTWKFNNNQLYLIGNGDTMIVIIESITNKQLIWQIHERKTNIRFSLTKQNEK